MGFLTVLSPEKPLLASAPVVPTVTATTSGTSASGSLTLTIPAGVALGNAMYIGIGSYSGSVSTPSGWVKNNTELASGLTLYLFTRIATAGDLGGATTVAFSGGSISMKGVFMSVKTTSGTLNLVTTLAQGGTTVTNSFSINSITTTVNNCLVFELVQVLTLVSGNVVLTAPANIQVQAALNADGLVAFCTQTQAVAGATGTNAATFTNTGTASNGFAYLKNAVQP